MLHIPFGAGRLGLGLVAPFFQNPGSELFLLNRAVSGSNPTGATSLSPGRRNELLGEHPDGRYFVRTPAGSASELHPVRYDGFCAYEDSTAGDIVRSIARDSSQRQSGVVVTASILSPSGYRPVIQALNALSRAKEREDASIGEIFLV